ncbi:MAG: response regulator [Magnetococcales bacterium]|nr:response regulator [Magnetococcales bacterium]
MKSPLQVLIIDDNPVDSTLLRVFLRKLARWQVTPVVRQNGEDAMIWLRDNEPDLVFVDYRLEGETGTDLIQQIKSAGCSAGFVLFTGHEGEEAILEAWRAGADDYIHKSELSLETLSRSIYHTLHKISTARALQEALDSLRRTKKDLEFRVLERTAQLSEAHEQLDTITSAAHDGIVMLDPGNRIIYWNPAAERIFGYPPAEILGQDFHTLLTKGELWGTLLEDIGRICREGSDTGHRLVSEAMVRHQNGHTFVMEGSFTAILMKGAWYVVGILRDITQQKEDMATLKRAKEEAEQATRLKDRFVSLVAHDLRGPFTTILGFLELLENDVKNPLSPKQKSFLAWVVESSKKMVRMIDELLNISRLKTGKITPERRFFDARFAGEKALENLRPQAEAKKITVANHVPENYRIHADPNLFGEVLHNLISNAVKFSRPGDQITLLASHDQPSSLAVKDTGVGIPASRLANLFKLEEKTSTTGTAGEHGTGFGLPFADEIMRAHGGTIRVVSEENKGSTFSVQLPSVTPRVLVIDDDPDFRKLLLTFLDRIGVQSTESPSARDALQKVNLYPHHLVICDVNMPEMNGFELLSQLRKDPKTKTLPVILITGDSSMESREKAFRMGADDFINKPIASNEFLPRVRHFVG